MKCENCRELMLAYVRNELAETDQPEFEEHIAQCVECTGELQGARKVLGLVEAADQPPIWQTLDDMIRGAFHGRASDIHIEPFEGRTRIRYRIDGVLRDAGELPHEMHEPLMTRIKMMAGMNIAERRAPQDGRILIEIEGKHLDLRVSIVPGVAGERVVMRLLAQAEVYLGLERLGLSAADIATLDGLLHAPHGLILVTGPTGSGKTTVLYSMLQRINHPGINVMSVEDPVEFILDGVTQIPINPRQGVTFASALRAVLRQDPDVVFCGEIRDLETAEVSIQTAITGHLVLTVLHTKDAVGALRRILDVGIERFLLADCLLGVTNQRLARKLCPACRQERAPTEEEIAWLRESGLEEIPAKIGQAVGCEQCAKTGYRGRTGVYEILVMDQELKNLIGSDADFAEVEKLAYTKVRPMRRDAAEKVAQGFLTVEEASRVLTYTL